MNLLLLVSDKSFGSGIKTWVNELVSPNPTMIFVIAIIGIWAFVHWRKFFVKTSVGVTLLVISILAMVWALGDHNFHEIITTPDNVPIVGMIFLVGFFTWLGMKRAVENDDLMAQGKPAFEMSEAKQKVFVWPDLVYSELICMVIFTVILIVWSLVLQAPLEEVASPAKTPNPSKAPWYFVGLQEDLIYYDPWIAGVLLPGFIILGLMAIPYVDKNPKGNGYYTFAERQFSWWFFFMGFLVLWIVPILIGTFLRGPNQAIFGPFEQWDPHKLPPIVNVDLADYFWIDLLHKPKPDAWYVREMPGFLLVGFYFVIVPIVLTKSIGLLRKTREHLGAMRYWVFMILMLCMVALPIKMVLRWTMNMKYFISIPEAFFNI